MSNEISKKPDYKLKGGIVKACAGLLQDSKALRVLTAVEQAERVIGQDYAINETAQSNRRVLVKMVKLNLINRKKHKRKALNRQFDMCVR